MMFGIQGLFSVTLDALDAIPEDPRQNFLARPYLGSDWPLLVSNIWLYLAGFASVLFFFINSRRFPSLVKFSRAAALIVFSVGLMMRGPAILNTVSVASELHWPAFLLFGFSICLVVTLYNSEELTAQWLSVVARSSVLVVVVVAVMLGFYCYAVRAESSQRAQYERQLREKDAEEAAELIGRYQDAPALSATELERLAAVSGGLLQSNREVSLRMGRHIYNAAGDLKFAQPPVFGAEESYQTVMGTIFPPPTFRTNKQRWQDAVKTFERDLSFDGALERSLFGNEDLRKKPPYKAYLRSMREELVPLPDTKEKSVLDHRFSGSLAEFKAALRARSLDQLEALPSHCEILFLAESDREEAEKLASALRKQYDGSNHPEMIIPAPEAIRLSPDSKSNCSQLAIFARGGSSYIKQVESLIEFLSESNPVYHNGKAPIAPSDDIQRNSLIRDLTGLNHSNFLDYSSGKGEGKQLSDRSLATGLFREASRITVLVEYGNPEKHFEIWIVPESENSAAGEP